MKPNLKLLLLIAALLYAQTINAQRPTEDPSLILIELKDMPQITEFLPGPPSPGDGRFYYDSCQFVAGKALRDTPRGEVAKKDASIEVSYMMSRFAEALERDFTPENYPKTKEYLEKSIMTARQAIVSAKAKYSRERPYQYFNVPTSLPEFEELELNTSYPSGHTTRSWVAALCLVSVDPTHQNDILKVGYEMGQSRIIVGYHFQSDVDDARVAATAAFARLSASKEWQKLRKKAEKEMMGK